MNQDNKKFEAAADRIISAIPSPTTQQVLRETAQQLGIPLWMLITGLLQRAYDTGEHTVPVLDPQWTMGNPAERPVIADAKCKECQQTYTPRWVGQEYCSAKCGSAAAKSAADRARVQLPLARFKVGEEPEGVAKSTIREAEAHGTGGVRPTAEVGATSDELGSLPDGTDPVAAIEREARAAIGA